MMKLTLALALCLPAQDENAIIAFEAPKEWTKEEPASTMRKAQYKIPDKEKTAKDAEMTLFFFGPNNTLLKANLDRWGQQMGAEVKPETIEGHHKVTLVDLKGTYTGDAAAGPMENARMLAAVVEAPDGPWYFKLVGPADTVGDWREEFIKLLKAAKK